MSAHPHSGSKTAERVWSVGLPMTVGVTLLALWHFGARSGGVSEVFLPGPGAVLGAFVDDRGVILSNLLVTSMEAVGALLLSVAVGILLSAAISLNAFVREAVYPSVLALQMIPKVALAPIFVVWLGIGFESKIVFGAFIAFIPVVVHSTAGLLRADPGVLRLGRSLSAGKWQEFTLIRVPFALPYFFTGLRISATLSVIGAVVAEFVSAQSGLGHYIVVAGAGSNTARMFAAIFALCGLGILIYGAVFCLEAAVKARWR